MVYSSTLVAKQQLAVIGTASERLLQSSTFHIGGFNCNYIEFRRLVMYAMGDLCSLWVLASTCLYVCLCDLVFIDTCASFFWNQLLCCGCFAAFLAKDFEVPVLKGLARCFHNKSQ